MRVCCRLHTGWRGIDATLCNAQLTNTRLDRVGWGRRRRQRRGRGRWRWELGRSEAEEEKREMMQKSNRGQWPQEKARKSHSQFGSGGRLQVCRFAGKGNDPEKLELDGNAIKNQAGQGTLPPSSSRSSRNSGILRLNTKKKGSFSSVLTFLGDPHSWLSLEIPWQGDQTSKLCFSQLLCRPEPQARRLASRVTGTWVLCFVGQS